MTQIVKQLFQADAADDGCGVKTNPQIAFDGALGIGLSQPLIDDVFTLRLSVADGMNISGGAADVDHQHIAPALFISRTVGADANALEHRHRRRQNHGNHASDPSSPFAWVIRAMKISRIASRAASTASVPDLGMTLSTADFFAGLHQDLRRLHRPRRDCRQRQSAPQAAPVANSRALCRMVSPSPPSTPPVSRIISGLSPSISRFLSALSLNAVEPTILAPAPSAACLAASTVKPGTLPTTTMRNPPAALLDARTVLPERIDIFFGRSLKERHTLVQVVSARSNPSRTSVDTVEGDWLRPINWACQIDSGDLGKSTAEIDEDGERIHTQEVKR